MNSDRNIPSLKHSHKCDSYVHLTPVTAHLHLCITGHDEVHLFLFIFRLQIP